LSAGGGLDFWSRRRAAVEAEERADLEQRDRLEEERRLQDLESRPDEDILKELNLPDPDTLGPGDDFRGFMGRAVPERIRRRALRKLWVSNPVLANLDELVDYGEDFTDAATVVENLQTAYQVGRGMLEHVAALDEQAGAPETATVGGGDGALVPVAGGEGDGMDRGGQSGAEAMTATPVETPARKTGIAASEGADRVEPATVGRRMRFRVIEAGMAGDA